MHRLRRFGLKLEQVLIEANAPHREQPNYRRRRNRSNSKPWACEQPLEPGFPFYQLERRSQVRRSATVANHQERWKYEHRREEAQGKPRCRDDSQLGNSPKVAE